ncbi:MAG: dihydropteroate synthase, partial [Enterovibrio sp.]
KLISKEKELDLATPKVMAILNATPDSFSDGGKHQRLESAIAFAAQALQYGAAIIDVGGESTRPGAAFVSENEELDRTIGIIEALRQRFDCWISIDTSKAAVMREAVAAGADLINDVRALTEPSALAAAAAAKVPICLMHMQGEPLTMQQAPVYQDIFDELDQFFSARIATCLEAGIAKEQLILDPGFGFGKKLAHNYQLLANLAHFHHFSLPLLSGTSRKSMLYKMLDSSPQDVLGASLASAIFAVQQGAHIVRVHDVKETVHALRVIQALNEI